MTLVLKQIDHDKLCHGWEWEVEDIDILAERVARVALGQYRHVAQILEGLAGAAPAGSAKHAADALKKLKIAKNGDTWQRDGWLFQIISWIAANQKKQGATLATPHIFHAHKGFDGMQLELSGDGKSVTAVVIFEDKATENARQTIKQNVWPDIVDLEAGERIAELTHEASAILERHQHLYPGLDIDDAIDRILWQEARRYRVSISIDDKHKPANKRERLFKHYDVSASGDVTRRRAETMHFDDLRKWMTDFSELVASNIKAIANV
ncbi:MAG: hypothetical protein HC788_02150 [Sphingopyxis sp.]|nr:hypothetical protein [Sphingopyxis sp.]